LLTPADIDNKKFSTTRLRPGYEQDQVDDFLDEAKAELVQLIRVNEELRSALATVLRGGRSSVPEARHPILTPAQVRDKQFTTTRNKHGYDEEEVDAFLDEIESELQRLLQEYEELRAKLIEVLPEVRVLPKRTKPVAPTRPSSSPREDLPKDWPASPPVSRPATPAERKSLGLPAESVKSSQAAVPPSAPAQRSDVPAERRGIYQAQDVRSDKPEVIEVAVRQGHPPGTLSVEVVSSPAGEAAATVALDVDGLLARRDQLQMAVLASGVASRRVLPETERPVHEVGRTLFTALLGSGEVAGRYRAAAALAADRGRRLRVVLRIDVPALAALPWEAMYDEAVGAYVCRQDQLVRHVGVVSAPPPLRILGVVSSPRGLPALDVEKEQHNLARALDRPIRQGRAELHWVSEATWAELHSILLEGPWHVVHYIGHGDFDPARDEGILALVADNGRAHHVAGHQLVDLMRQASPMPRLIVLNSCASARGSVTDLFSGTAAALVRGGISAVAAMQYAISDESAIAFARGFYAAIAQGRSVDEALSSGRVAILGTSANTLEWLTPVLYLRGRDAHLFAMQ
jgi:DivIVA domain-containing protein